MDETLKKIASREERGKSLMGASHLQAPGKAESMFYSRPRTLVKGKKHIHSFSDIYSSRSRSRDHSKHRHRRHRRKSSDSRNYYKRYKTDRDRDRRRSRHYHYNDYRSRRDYRLDRSESSH